MSKGALGLAFFGTVGDTGMPYAFEPVGRCINNSPRIMPPLVDVDSRCRIICSKPCHGLNALSYADVDFVCNPATSNYFKALPPANDDTGVRLPRRQIFLPQLQCGCVMFAGRLGLGYEQEACLGAIVIRGEESDNAIRLQNAGVPLPQRRDLGRGRPSSKTHGKLYWMVDAQLGPSSSGVEIIELDVSKRKFEVLQGMKFVPVLFQESLANPCHSTV